MKIHVCAGQMTQGLRHLHQSRQLESSSRDPRSRRKEMAPTSCLLTSTLFTHVCVCVCRQTSNNSKNIGLGRIDNINDKQMGDIWMCVAWMYIYARLCFYSYVYMCFKKNLPLSRWITSNNSLPYFLWLHCLFLHFFRYLNFWYFLVKHILPV